MTKVSSVSDTCQSYLTCQEIPLNINFKPNYLMKTNIYTQHEEHTEWLSKLAFYKDEVPILQKRIAEVLQKNTSKEVAQQVEHFQNQLTIQLSNINQIQHQVNHDENAIQNSIKNNPIASDHRKTEDHKEEREIVESFEKHFIGLRSDLNTFLSKWM